MKKEMDGRSININLGEYVDLDKVKYKALQSEIVKLYEELETIKPMENNTMRREKIVGMIEKLESLSVNYRGGKVEVLWNKDSRSIVIVDDDFIFTGVRKDKNESRITIDADGIKCSATNQEDIIEEANKSLFNN